jgi:hypothetical protein
LRPRILRYDVEAHCVPIECPCPSWFPDDGTPQGNYDWSELHPSVCDGPRTFTTEIEYSCPRGYVFDISALDPAKYTESSKMKWKCGELSEWIPAVQPRCHRKWKIVKNKLGALYSKPRVSAVNCTDDPYHVYNDNVTNAYDWVAKGRNNTFTSTVNYT